VIYSFCAVVRVGDVLRIWGAHHLAFNRSLDFFGVSAIVIVTVGVATSATGGSFQPIVVALLVAFMVRGQLFTFLISLFALRRFRWTSDGF
jgi:hypothetical protein